MACSVHALHMHGSQEDNRATHLLIDQGCHWQAVEAVRERAPQADVVSALALVVEAVDAVDRGALVVPAEEEEVLRVLDLQPGLSGIRNAAWGRNGDSHEAGHQTCRCSFACPKAVPHLESEQQADGFKALLATIDVVAQKQVVCLRREPAILEQPQQVGILPVDVT